MHFSYIIAALSGLAVASAQATGQLGNAIVASGLPLGAAYQAVLPNRNDTTIRGSIIGTTSANGTGVNFNVNFYGFPSEALYGPFIYHIHAFPVPPSGDCAGTLAHLDPFIRGESPPCDPTRPAACQVGDLSGKHGNITTPVFTASYLDSYTSTQPGVGSFFGNRSIVIHTKNTTRLTCANFTLVANGTSNRNSTTPTTPPPAPFTGAAAIAKAISGGWVLASSLAAFLLLL